MTSLSQVYQCIDLSGAWAFELDPRDVGLSGEWFKHPLSHRIQLPGSLQAQGFGEDISVDTQWMGDIVDRSWFTEPRYEKYRQPGNIKVPFWLQPDKHYEGAAWYQCEIEIPNELRDKRITLSLERPHWETRVWFDDKSLDSNDSYESLSVPHMYDLDMDVPAGRHRLTIRVDNRMIINVGPNAHSVSDHTQTNWNGIVGRIELSARSPIWIDDVQVYPDVARKAAKVTVRIGNITGKTAQARLTLKAEAYNAARPHQSAPMEVTFIAIAQNMTMEVDYALGDGAESWDEFNPALHRLTVRLDASTESDTYADQRVVTFGLREIKVVDGRITVNGRNTFIRGTLECCIFPLTGYPPTDVESWKRIIRTCKAHGLNQIRFHSWCPPEAVFIAADELGFYYQVECASWANQGSSIGEGGPLDEWLYREGERIIDAYGNHPSFVMMAYGNEPAGRHKEYLTEWVKYWKQRDSRRIHTSGAGWPAIPENDYHNIPGPRIQAWMQGLKSRINALPPETRTDYADDVTRANGIPIVSHEIGQWCAYPNFDEIKKYTGPLKAGNFEIFRDTLEANHMGDQARDFLIASGKLQVLCYKEDIESALRTRGFGGFHLLDLHDFPGQGTALVGVLDPFWDSKGYITPDEFRRFCNSTVLLARMSKRVWADNETFSADIEVAHFGREPLRDAIAVWKLVDEDRAVVGSGKLPAATIPIDSGIKLGAVNIDLKNVKPARKYAFVVGLEGTPFENDWDIWVFPEKLAAFVPSDIMVTDRLDDNALAQLKAGSKVLLALSPNRVKSDVAIGFSSVFWNTAWTRRQAPHTLGILCDPKHPAFAEFPTEYHGNWQWWELIHGSAAMILDAFPPALRPLVQPIDTWFENRRLGLLFEAKSEGGGKLMVCSMDLHNDLDKRLVARQLLRSVSSYMNSGSFNPSVEIEARQVQELVA